MKWHEKERIEGKEGMENNKPLGYRVRKIRGKIDVGEVITRLDQRTEILEGS